MPSRATQQVSFPKRISLREAAARHDVSPQTVRRWIASGKVTGYRAGQLIRVDVDEVDNVFRAMPTAGTSSGAA